MSDKTIDQTRDSLKSTLQNHMLNCPILSNTMEDPVVVAEKLTYEQVGLFKPPVPPLDEKALATFLQHVALGEQDKAEALLKKTPALALGKGTFKDHAGRTFTNITGFQYALWALDWHMWKMILPYFEKLPEGKAAANEQCSTQEALTEELGYGPRYKMEDLVNALKTYIAQYNALDQAKNWDEIKKLWAQGVGGAQRQTVAHVAQTYCHPEKSSDPRPNWMSEGVTRGSEILTRWFDRCDRGWYRGGAAGFGMESDFLTGVMKFECMAGERDLVAIESLFEARTDQLSELKSSLAIPSITSHL